MGFEKLVGYLPHCARCRAVAAVLGGVFGAGWVGGSVGLGGDGGRSRHWAMNLPKVDIFLIFPNFL